MTAGTFEGRIKGYMDLNGNVKLDTFIMDNSNYETSKTSFSPLRILINEAAKAMHNKELIPYTWYIEEVRYLK